ncbi:putative O-methyltransferase YrrM [Streptosporangium becharense]|uniref:Putative O-methyltransferase YrrM n=1 Tax=Streptosporangium becharense TaxID=1816182 RepID=A0A7W9MJG4_9ACTN|nr:class I SAM-dependent methyltransferase [Streptosporangium becharense]MBB2911629.1 putative O-methyltransferase YrrM [Streptosporangium becharense]MBB5822553.1 putative O-methyltransferase YrrM [Streptosporangium becharense]
MRGTGTLPPMSVSVVVRNSVRPGYLPVMARKALRRLRAGYGRETRAATAWAASRAEDLHAWGERVDEALWRESVEFARSLAASARPRVEELRASGVDLGGPAGIELLYLLTRVLRPATALETGVAAGWSTAAVLAAIRTNGSGRLHSSDFPFFRIPDPERYIGYVVPEELKEPWTLRTRGDRRNLEEILLPGTEVDLVHYDSDKSRQGREFFIRRTAPHLTCGHVFVMDDIQDDLVFREYAERQPHFRVFEYQGKYVGVTGPGLRLAEEAGGG